MARCTDCQQEMSSRLTRSCVCPVILVDADLRLRIRYGHDWDGRFSGAQARCHDCNVAVGGFHHAGCDVEECPVCHHQLLWCGGRHD